MRKLEQVRALEQIGGRRRRRRDVEYLTGTNNDDRRPVYRRVSPDASDQQGIG